jgi:hypothetical protein
MIGSPDKSKVRYNSGTKTAKEYFSEDGASLFVLEGKNDSLLIGVLFLLLAVFLFVLLIFSH